MGRFIQIFTGLFISALFVNAQNIKINEICANNYICYEDDYGEHGDWIEFYYSGSSSVNLGGMYLTDDFSNLTKYQIPTNNASATTISGHDHLVFWFDQESYKGPTHANFKLSNSGEQFALVASNGTTILDSITFPELTYDVTYGRTTNGSSSWSYFPVPTPDHSNTGGGYAGIAGKAVFSLDAGFYPSSIQLTLTTPDPQSTIYYSLNGNEPSPSNGILYTGPITILTHKAVRARVYKTNYIPGEVTTRTYFINRPHDLMVLSVVTDSSNLWDENTGIYCFGVDDYDHFYPYYGANFWKSWKRPAHLEIFETSGAEIVSQNLKLSLSGNTSRVYAQKSMNLEAEDALGKKSITYQIFPQLQTTEFKALKVRNGGSDWSSTGIRDAFNHTILEGAVDVDHQAYRSVILYLNGAYWGVINLTEKLDEDYLKGHYPSINKDSVDILFSNAEVEKGDASNYNAMINYISANSLALQSHYNYIKTQMDVKEYIDYFESRIYFASTDWPNKNIKYWRPKDQSMKWRWIMWDTDRSDLLTTNPNHPCDVNHNTLAWATTSNSVASWAQFLLNNLLLNAEFKSNFITRFANHMNFTFCPMRTDSVLNVFRSRLHNELPAHITRWEHTNDTIDYFTAGYYHSRAEWNTEVDTIKYFFDNRARYIRKYIMQKFGTDTSHLTLNKVPPQGGTIEIDSFRVPANPCNLVYFNGYPVSIKAVASPGYVFTGWNSSGGSTLPITWTPHNDTTITAYFSPNSVSQPTAASTNFSAAFTGCNNIQLQWSPGNGSSRLVIARAGSAVNAFPSDYQAYAASSVFGNGAQLGSGNYVIYSGSGSSCSITGLSPGTSYYFAIIEFNGIASTSKYNTTTFLTGNATTTLFTFTATASASVLCAGGAATLTASGGLTYLWSPSAGLSSTTGSSVIATPVTSTTYTVVATNADGCQSSSVLSITVNPLPSVTLPNFQNACVLTSALPLSGGSPAGGAYSGNFVSGGVFNPSAAGIGSHFITYTYTNSNGCTNSASAPITVVGTPNVILHTIDSICVNASPLLLNGGTPAGGVYSGTGVSGGYFNPTLAGTGGHAVVYTYTDGSGCTGSDTSWIQVNAIPVVSLNSFPAVCADASPVLLSGGAPSGGTYSGPGVSGGYFDPGTAGPGSHTISYTYSTGNGCANTAVAGIVVNPVPVVTLNPFNDVCIDAPPFLLSGGSPSGGTYSGAGVSGGYFDPGTAGTGSHAISYTYSTGTGCTNTAVSGIVVSPVPVVTLNPFNDVCMGAPPVLLSGGSPSGGTYSGTGVSGGFFDPGTAGLGNHIIYYSYSNSSGCTNSDAAVIYVDSTPVVTLSAFSNICLDAAPLLLTGGTPAGGSYSGAGISGGYFDPSTAGTGTHQIVYTYSNLTGCPGHDTAAIFVNPVPSVSLGNDTTICASDNLLLDAGFGMTSYLWSTGETTQSILADSTGVGLGAGLFMVTVTNDSGCIAGDDINITFDICTSAGNRADDFSVQVYPNPFSEGITILAGEKSFKVTLLDMLGKVVLHKTFYPSNSVIHPAVSPGMYFLLVETDRGSVTLKLIKTN